MEKVFLNIYFSIFYFVINMYTQTNNTYDIPTLLAPKDFIPPIKIETFNY